MRVYIVNKEYNTDYNSDSFIFGVYDSIEKAQDVLLRLYRDDCNWIQEYIPEGATLEEDIYEENYTYVQYNCNCSKNWIKEFDVE